MAIESDFTRLHNLVRSLEERVNKLEGKPMVPSASTTESVRMILMGPPGAGK